MGSHWPQPLRARTRRPLDAQDQTRRSKRAAAGATRDCSRWQSLEGSQEMTRSSVIPAAPVGQQGPPARAAASAAGALRSARGSLLLTTGTASTALDAEREY